MKQVIKHFDLYLKKRGLSFTATIIGGAALNIMDVTNRNTKDIDCIDPEIPDAIKKAAIEFAKTHPDLNLNANKWLNNGPISILKDLDKDWKHKTQIIFQGKAIQLSTLDRVSLLKTKLFAYCDRDTDFDDCVMLRPSKKELELCFDWVLERDGSEFWPAQVKNNLII